MSKGIVFAKNTVFFQKNADASKIKKALVLKTIFSKYYLYVCAYVPNLKFVA